MNEGNPPDSRLEANKKSVTGPPPQRDTKSVPTAPRRYTRSKRGRNILIFVVALVVLVGSVFFWRYLSGYESTDDAQVDVHLYPVSARISGYVVKVNVDDNQFVQKG